MRLLIDKRPSFKFLSAIVLLMFALAAWARSGPAAAAQAEADQLTGLSVELWPDYDRPAMLVLLSGSLPPNTPLPATITIPLPEGADVNAVARVGDDGTLLSDVEYTLEGGLLTAALPSTGFRVEYYTPLTISGDQRGYVFNWLSGLAVAQLSAAVQQPSAAEGFVVSPEPVGTFSNRGDGLLYHTLPSRSLAPGELYTVNVDYTMTTPTLSAPAQTTAPVAPEIGATGSNASAESAGGNLVLGRVSPWWLLGIFAVATLVGLAWYLGRRQSTSAAARRKPQPARTSNNRPNTHSQPASNAARYCHNCGRPATPDDKFCRDCGTRLKDV